MFSITAEIQGVKETKTILGNIERNLSDLTPAWREIELNFFDMLSSQFASEGGQNKWKPLSARYAAWKSKVAPGMPIMQLYGKLKPSLTGRGAGNVSIITPYTATFGTSVANSKGFQYPIVHQTGSLSGKIPQRKIIDVTPARAANWGNILEHHIMRGAENSGWKESMASDYGFEESF